MAMLTSAQAALAAETVADGSMRIGPWRLADPIEVVGSAEGVFHEMSASGRRSLAVDAETVALVWASDPGDLSRVVLARKPLSGAGFSAPLQVSGSGDAYEPSIVALGGGRFAVAWEEDGRVLVRVVGVEWLGPPLRLSSNGAHVSLATVETVGGTGIVAVWSERTDGVARIMAEVIFLVGASSDGSGAEAANGAAETSPLRSLARCPVEALAPSADQLYPTAAQVGDRLLIAWEDRRPGHTIIMAAVAESAASFVSACRIAPASRVSEDPPGPDLPYGSGHGVARVAVAPYGVDRLLAAWEDKREFRHGYDIYASHYGAGTAEGSAFGPNERVQDDFGELAAQWHVTVAGHPSGALAVAWSDERDGHSDIMMSLYDAGAWSEDVPLPGAAGAGEESHPVLAIDAAGDLHAAWVTREVKGGPTAISYVSGRRED
jgi:hypothetical protein